MLGHFHSVSPSSTGSGSEDTCSALRFLGELLLTYFPEEDLDRILPVAMAVAGTAAADTTYAVGVVGDGGEELLVLLVVLSSSRSLRSLAAARADSSESVRSVSRL